MHRFFIDSNQLTDNTIIIEGPDFKHIKNVLRMAEGDKLEVVLDRYVYVSEIDTIDKDKVYLNILSKEKGKGESPINIVLFQGLAKGDKMDYIIQKATELGVSEIYPLITRRTIVNLDNKKREEKKINRWQTIAMESAKQCKREIIPRVHNILTFNQMINLLRNQENILIPYELEESYGLGEFIQNYKKDKINIIIGPEGGFQFEEVERVKGIGGRSISMGSRILRTETAALVLSSILQFQLGDIGEKKI